MEDGREDRAATRSSEAIVDSSFSLSFHPNGRCIGLAARAHSPSLRRKRGSDRLFSSQKSSCLFGRSPLGGMLQHCTHLTDAGLTLYYSPKDGTCKLLCALVS